MDSRFIDYEGSRIHYLVFGEGEKLLFCFHGFNETADIFSILEPSLKKRYKVLSIDLPLHGKTQWQAGKFFLKNDLKNMLTLLLQQLGYSRFSLMGYSMGGKMVVTAVTQFPGEVEEVFLIAPDGLKKNVWYNLSVYPKFGRKLFHRMILYPEKYFRLIDILTALKLLPSSVQKFLRMQLETGEKRQKVYDVWITIKDFNTDSTKVRQILNQFSIKLFLFYGQFDGIIKPSSGYHFVKGVNQYKIKLLPKGHNIMKDYLNDAIEEVLSEK